jgi:hypothetical protein
MIVLECPFCSAHLEIGEDRAGRSMTCPFCKGQVEVPKPQKPPRHEEYDLEADDGHPPASLTSVAGLTDADLDELDEEDEAPQKKRRRPKMEWHLIVGGFGFPWTSGAVLHWLLIAIWATIAGWMYHVAVSLGIERPLGDADMYQSIVALLAALGAMVAGVCCAAIAGIHGLTILLETTAGNDRMQNWPNVGLFLDWVGQLWFIFNAAMVSLMLGLGLNWILQDIVFLHGATITVTIFFTFPILLLCTLETDSPFLPVSGIVLASLGRHAIAWLTFYIQAAILLGAPAAAGLSIGPHLDPRLAIPLGGLVFAAVVMIYFRLLGRLAYYCSVEPLGEEDEELLNEVS